MTDRERERLREREKRRKSFEMSCPEIGLQKK